MEGGLQIQNWLNIALAINISELMCMTLTPTHCQSTTDPTLSNTPLPQFLSPQTGIHTQLPLHVRAVLTAV